MVQVLLEIPGEVIFAVGWLFLKALFTNRTLCPFCYFFCCIFIDVSSLHIITCLLSYFLESKLFFFCLDFNITEQVREAFRACGVAVYWYGLHGDFPRFWKGVGVCEGERGTFSWKSYSIFLMNPRLDSNISPDFLSLSMSSST